MDIKIEKIVGGGVCIGIIKIYPMTNYLNIENLYLIFLMIWWMLDKSRWQILWSIICYPKISRGYSDAIVQDVIIKMKIDFNLQGLYYSVDGDEYVETSYKIDKNNSYRLVASFTHNKGHQVELL